MKNCPETSMKVIIVHFRDKHPLFTTDLKFISIYLDNFEKLPYNNTITPRFTSPSLVKPPTAHITKSFTLPDKLQRKNNNPNARTGVCLCIRVRPVMQVNVHTRRCNVLGGQRDHYLNTYVYVYI